MQNAFAFLMRRPDAVTTAGCRRTRLAPSARDRQSVASSPVASYRVTTDMTGRVAVTVQDRAMSLVVA